MFPNNFWPNNFYVNNFFYDYTDYDETAYDLIIINGNVVFDLVLDDGNETVIDGAGKSIICGRFTKPVLESYGGLIQLSHNFPYTDGDTAVIGYKDPEGNTGTIDTVYFDGSYAKAIIPEDLFDVEGSYWYFNVIVSGERSYGTFSIRSRAYRTRSYDGLIID